MTFDWTIRAMLAGVVGIVGALIAAGLGAWGYVVLFVLVSVAGWGLFAYMTTHAP